jgi:hypothetical protein
MVENDKKSIYERKVVPFEPPLVLLKIRVFGPTALLFSRSVQTQNKGTTDILFSRSVQI